MSDPIPCRICLCLDGVPGLCHALTPKGLACFRVDGHSDICSACTNYDPALRASFPSSAPIEAFAAHYRAKSADEVAARRGASIPGSYALRVHAARLRRKSQSLLIAAGVFLAAAPKNPPPERDRPLCPPASA